MVLYGEVLVPGWSILIWSLFSWQYLTLSYRMSYPTLSYHEPKPPRGGPGGLGHIICTEVKIIHRICIYNAYNTHSIWTNDIHIIVFTYNVNFFSYMYETVWMYSVHCNMIIWCNISLSKKVGLYANTYDALMMYWGELYDFTNLQGPEVAHRHDDAWCISTLFCTQMIVHRTSRIIRRK